MAEVVEKTGVTKEKGYLTIQIKQATFSLKKWLVLEKGGGNAEKVATAGVTRESGYLYFIDKNGDVARSPMARGRKKQNILLKKPSNEGFFLSLQIV